MITGVGIHGGTTCRVWLHRVEGPIRFRRGRTEVHASVDAVYSTERCVTLAARGGRVAVVEHLLAALHVAGFWHGVVVEVEGDELPILDGSALPWFEEVEQLGSPPPAPAALVLDSVLELEGGLAKLTPGERSIDVHVDYAHPAIGRQRWHGGPGEWPGLLSARTFGFLSELDSLRSMGLALGADTENAIVFGDNGPLEPLRHPDEPVRHKALDLLGDLALLGRPLQAAVRIERGSHRIHVNLMRYLLQHSTTKAAT